MDKPYFVNHSSVYGYLGCFNLLAIGNDAAMNIGVQISFQVPTFNSLGYTPRSRIARSYDNLYV